MEFIMSSDYSPNAVLVKELNDMYEKYKILKLLQ